MKFPQLRQTGGCQCGTIRYEVTEPAQLGTWICSGPKPDQATRDALRVRARTLDDTPWPRPTAHFWTRSAQPWVVLPEEDQRFRDATGGPRLDASRLGVSRSRFVAG